MMKDKGLVHFNGKMLVEHVIESVKKITSHIIIVTQNEAYNQFGYPCYADVFKEKGALGGIYTGLVHSATKKNLIVGCDMPFLSENILNALINKSSDEDVLLTKHSDKAEPLCSIYNRSIITHIRSLLEQNQLKITNALEGLKTRVISFDGEEWFRGDEFANINSDDELRQFENNNNNKK